MEDIQIVDLYWKRNESAVTQTAKKYGVFCKSIAKNILTLNEDAEECVNDTYYKAWNSMPPQRPQKLRAWLGKVVRNIAIDLWNKNHAQKRYSGIELLLSELEDCIPSPNSVENTVEEFELTDFLNLWLSSLSSDDRIIFVRRYWNGKSVKELAAEFKVTSGNMAKRIFRLRKQLKTSLEREGYSL